MANQLALVGSGASISPAGRHGPVESVTYCGRTYSRRSDRTCSAGPYGQKPRGVPSPRLHGDVLRDNLSDNPFGSRRKSKIEDTKVASELDRMGERLAHETGTQAIHSLKVSASGSAYLAPVSEVRQAEGEPCAEHEIGVRPHTEEPREHGPNAGHGSGGHPRGGAFSRRAVPPSPGFRSFRVGERMEPLGPITDSQPSGSTIFRCA